MLPLRHLLLSDPHATDHPETSRLLNPWAQEAKAKGVWGSKLHCSEIYYFQRFNPYALRHSLLCLCAKPLIKRRLVKPNPNTGGGMCRANKVPDPGSAAISAYFIYLHAIHISKWMVKKLARQDSGARGDDMPRFEEGESLAVGRDLHDVRLPGFTVH